VLAGVSLVFVILRLIVRNPTKSELSGWDDVIITVAWLAVLPLSVLDVFLYKHGLGKDIWRVPFDDITQLLKYFWAGEMPYVSTVSSLPQS
jgi:hypothetical protein